MLRFSITIVGHLCGRIAFDGTFRTIRGSESLIIADNTLFQISNTVVSKSDTVSAILEDLARGKTHIASVEKGDARGTASMDFRVLENRLAVFRFNSDVCGVLNLAMIDEPRRFCHDLHPYSRVEDRNPS